MFCTNCGHQRQDNEEFCSNCGISLINNSETERKDVNNLSQETFAQNLANSPINSFILKKWENFWAFLSRNKKRAGIFLSILVVVFLLGFLYEFLFGFEKFSWNKNYSDYNLNYVTQANIKLGINFSKEQEIDKIKYKTTCGDISNNKLEIIWDLQDATGKCVIEASYKMKKIKKEYNVIPTDIESKELALDYDIDLEPEDDSDFDGLTNKQESEYKTNPLLSDSDMDGLSDYDEIFTYKTDPNKKDTDDDGIGDYDEIMLGLDPLKKDSKGDGVIDGERTLTFDYKSDKLQMTIKGRGNIASTEVDINTNTKISSKKGLIDKLYSFYTEGKILEALLTINYDEEELIRYGLNEDNLAIYYYNEKDLKYEKVDTIINKDNKTLTTTLKHFSKYVVGDSSLTQEKIESEVLFILDNSWSMYTNDQYKEITGKDILNSSLDGSDSKGLRFSLTSDLISKLAKKDYKMGLSEFRSDYANVLKIGSDEKNLKEKLKQMDGKFITSIEGTNISSALKGGISEFSNNNDSNKYIVLLTDGRDASLWAYTKDIIEKALSKNIKICSIGFGKGSDNSNLVNISNTTGCKFYSSSDVDGLIELFDNIKTELDDNLVDIDGDDNPDGMLIADSGFVVNRDGFSFKNYGTNLSSGGHCYGMATFAELYYKKQLPLKLDSKTVKKDKSYAYNLSNTYFKKYANLYDYKLQTNDLKYEFGFDAFDEEMPADFRTLENDTLVYTSKYKELIEKTGIYDFSDAVKSGLSRDDQLKKYGFSYTNSINVLFNEDKMQTETNFSNEDRQMFNAIYAGFIRQNAISHYSSGSDFTLWLRNVVGTENTIYKGGNGFINILKTRLQDKDAPVIFARFSGGLHAINAISLVQDIDNPNYYYIGVYDNNYPGEKRYVDVECNKKTCVTKANSYYKKSGEVIRITPSLQYDLEFYNS